MSRIAKLPIELPKGVEVQLHSGSITLKGAKGSHTVDLPDSVKVVQEGNVLNVTAGNAQGWALAGTYRALIASFAAGVSKGFEKKLELVGVGYRAQVKGKILNLALGLSHPVDYPIPEGVEVQTPSQTEVFIRSVDKQKVGQVAAEVRSFRPPEPYKGKGVKYSNEKIIRKEAKKK